MPVARLHRIATAQPDDTTGLQALIHLGAIDPDRVLAVIGKTEGNGCVNDFTRAFAVSALQRVLPGGIAMVMSGGTEGGLSPHLLVMERLEGDEGTGPALAIGQTVTADMAPHDLGTAVQIQLVAAGVREAMAAAGITGPQDVHFVQIKCPLLTSARIAASPVAVQTHDTLKSMALSRGAAALGVALALNEISETQAATVAVGVDTAVWSSRASTSAGVELLGHEIVVMGMSASWSGDLEIAHAVMRDAIDTEPVRKALGSLGFETEGQLDETARNRLVAVLAKADPGRSGLIRGLRHTMLDDSDIAATRHARAFVGGGLAGLLGRTDIYVSGGAEHQGPDGGGPVALIAHRKPPRATQEV